MSDKSDNVTERVVSAILYGLAMSTMVSVLTANYQRIREVAIAIKKTNLLVWNVVPDVAWYCVGIIVFLGLYFLDECQSRVRLNESLAIVCTGWILFVFQILLVVAWRMGSLWMGVLGTSLISIGLLSHVKRSCLARWVLAENIVWIICLCGVAWAGRSCVWMILSSVILIVSHIVREVVTTEKERSD